MAKKTSNPAYVSGKNRAGASGQSNGNHRKINEQPPKKTKKTTNPAYVSGKKSAGASGQSNGNHRKTNEQPPKKVTIRIIHDFKCRRCNRDWTSTTNHPDESQTCNNCKTKVYPSNKNGRRRDKQGDNYSKNTKIFYERTPKRMKRFQQQNNIENKDNDNRSFCWRVTSFFRYFIGILCVLVFLMYISQDKMLESYLSESMAERIRYVSNTMAHTIVMESTKKLLNWL